MVFRIEELGFEEWLEVCRERAFWVEGATGSKAWSVKEEGQEHGGGGWGSSRKSACDCPPRPCVPCWGVRVNPKGSGEPQGDSSREETWSDL